MVGQKDEYPQFPTLECNACQEHFEVPRKRVVLQQLGLQIIMDWDAAEAMMKFHHQTHSNDLVTGIEEYLRALSG